MHNSVEYCKVHHYADDTILVLTDNSLKKTNKEVNRDLSLICHWLRANEINLNAKKTKIINFPTKK